MRNAIFWLIGASLAFFVTAGAFLVLANFGITPRASDPIPRDGTSEQRPGGPKLALSFSEEGLEGLQRRQNQPLTLYLTNRGEGELESVNLELAVSSEDTASPRARKYQKTVTGLAPGEVEEVNVMVDLSPPVESFAVLGEKPGGDRWVLEATAYTPGAPSVIKTAVISP